METRWNENQTTNHEYDVGRSVNVSFTEDIQGTGRYPYISKERGRKHIVTDDWLEGMPEAGIDYQCEIISDSRPGEIGGVLKVKLDPPTAFGEKQLMMRDRGYVYEESYSKSIFFTEKEVEDQIKNFRSLKPSDYIIEEFGRSDGSQRNVSDKFWGVWVKDDNLPSKKFAEKNPTKEIVIDTILPIEEIPNENSIRVLDIVVDKIGSKGKLVPHVDLAKFTLDRRTMTNVYNVLSAYGRRSPLLLEGDTDTSKSSSVDLAAEVVGAEVEVIDMSGQTDVTELIGKFVPNDGLQRVRFESLVAGYNSSNESDREKAYSRVSVDEADVMKRAHEEGRALTSEESTKIALAHGLNISDRDWVWVDGRAVTAAKNGRWLKLEEFYLAEPQIVERLNALFGKPPSIVLSENGGIKIGAGGDFEIPDTFFIVATTNSSGMEGRAHHSDAIKRRFTDYFTVSSPTIDDYKEMLNLLIFGIQPKFEFMGVKYQAEKTENPAYGNLRSADKPTLDKLVNILCEYQMEVRNMAHPESGEKTIGTESHRKGGRYTFTRANLISAIDYISKEQIVDPIATVRAGKKVFRTDIKNKLGRAVERFYIGPVYKEDEAAMRSTWNAHAFVQI